MKSKIVLILLFMILLSGCTEYENKGVPDKNKLNGISISKSFDRIEWRP